MATPRQREEVAAGGAPWRILPFLAPLLTAGAVLPVYLRYLSAQYNFDGTVFALWLTGALHTGDTGNLFHPYHLLFGPLGYVLGRALAAAGVELPAVLLLQILDAILAALCLAVFQLLCLRLTRDGAVSLAATLLLAFSFGIWWAAVEAEVYILESLLALIGFGCLWSWTRPGASAPWALRASNLGLVACAIVAAHIAGGLFIPGHGFGMLWYARTGGAQVPERGCAAGRRRPCSSQPLPEPRSPPSTPWASTPAPAPATGTS